MKCRHRLKTIKFRQESVLAFVFRPIMMNSETPEVNLIFRIMIKVHIINNL